MKNIKHYFKAVKCRTQSYIYDRIGFHTDRHIVVIESDDWGSVRMPSLETLHRLQDKGISFFTDFGYDTHDSLASNEDLQILIDTLSKYKDKDGNPAKLTMNCVLANPDFDKIEASGFKEYHYELFTESLKRYPNHDRAFSLWKEGMAKNVLKPQFHGREHLNAQMWLRLLQNKKYEALQCFNEGVWSFDLKEEPQGRNHVLSAYNIFFNSDKAFVIDSVKEGLYLFESLFGFKSESMIAPNYTWDFYIEEVAGSSGVKYLQGGTTQRHSQYAYSKGLAPESRYMGQKNRLGQIYMIRNCNFEPNQDKSCSAESTFAEIEKAFSMHRPAIISSHRQNFIGALNPKDRNRNIEEFDKLLNNIVRRYPDVEFMFSDECGKIMA